MMKRNSIYSILIFLGALSFLTETSALTAIECKDGTLLGIKELVDSVEMTVEQCTNSTSNKAELFSCIFKQLDMHGEDGKPVAEKIKGFFKNLFSARIIDEAKELTKKLNTCAETYAQSFSTTDLDVIGKAGDAFANCFFDATKKFTAYVRNACKPVEMKMEPPK